ncbi:hypothetical protein [Polyangium mundeleinium]|uniref:DUF3892 domain-containing protein n=1 Tax=Polyangium mundeleinium TaxID=2995306 RepID=A0ABT5EGL1_9BACT|nr:hypothetical protein [Polyangium mundeleinium]MDC0740960.1 hypothetical protein [Polyangium mundeleinium]
MAKYIGCVEHEDGRIKKLRVYESKEWKTKDRKTVVSEIDDSKTEYYTWYYNPKTEKYESGSRVNVVWVNRVAFLRTDRNNYAADNLGSLPALDRCPF